MLQAAAAAAAERSTSTATRAEAAPAPVRRLKSVATAVRSGAVARLAGGGSGAVAAACKDDDEDEDDEDDEEEEEEDGWLAHARSLRSHSLCGEASSRGNSEQSMTQCARPWSIEYQNGGSALLSLPLPEEEEEDKEEEEEGEEEEAPRGMVKREVTLVQLYHASWLPMPTMKGRVAATGWFCHCQRSQTCSNSSSLDTFRRGNAVSMPA